MMSKPKFTDYNMRDEFSFPAFVSSQLIEFNGIKGIDPESSVPGLLTRKDGETLLELAAFPSKTGFKKTSAVVNYEDKIMSQDDSSDWYASSWDGNMCKRSLNGRI